MLHNSRIIYAPAGSGKTESLLDGLAKHITLLKGPDIFQPKRLIIVPYAEQAKRLKDLLLKKLDRKLLFGRCIMSYHDFLKWIFPELGGKGISEIQRKLILEDVLKSIPLDYYEIAREIPGFVSSLSNFISEWKGLFLKEDEFEKAVSLFPKDSIEVLKFRDLKIIYLAYEGRLKALGFQDFDDIFQSVLIHSKEKLEILRGLESISFDGFYDFGSPQFQLIKSIREHIPEFNIYLTHEEGSREDLFDLTIQTIRKLEKIGFKKQTSDSKRKENKRTSKKDLQIIEKTLFTGKPSAIPPQNIEIFEAVGLRGEILWMARKILKLKRKTKMPWSDFAVLFRQIGDYESYVRDVFGEYKIPHVVHERKKLRENPWARHVLGGLAIAENHFEDPEEVFRFLRSSYLTLLALKIGLQS